MRRFLTLCLSCFLIFSLATCASASIALPTAVVPPITPLSVRHIPVNSPWQPCTLPVTIVQYLADGTTSEFTIYPVVLNIQYRYYVTVVDGESRGGYGIAGDEYPKSSIVPDANMTHKLNASVNEFGDPQNFQVTGNIDTYTVLISGGGIDVTYNRVIYYNTSGDVIRVERDTARRAYYYTHTDVTPSID